MRRALLTVSACLLALATAAGEPELPFKVTGVSGRVEKGRTECVFRVELAAGKILRLDMPRSGISSWTDDRGTEMGTKPAEKVSDRRTHPWYSAASAGKDGRVQEITAVSPRAAAAGAKSFSLQGLLKLKYGTKVSKGKLDGVLLANDGVFRIGAQEVRISGVVQKENYSEFQLKFADAGEGFHVQELQLYDAAGKRVFASRSPISARGPEGKRSPTVSFSGIRRRLTRATFSYVIWTDAREVKLPFTVTVPAGAAVVRKPDPTTKKPDPTTKKPDPTTKKPDPATKKPDPTVKKPVTAPVVSAKYGLKIEKGTFGVSEPPTVTFTKPLVFKKGERYVASLVPAEKPDSYWGFWKLVPSGAKDLNLRAPRSAGDYELRLGQAKWPATTYTVVERIKVKVE